MLICWSPVGARTSYAPKPSSCPVQFRRLSRCLVSLTPNSNPGGSGFLMTEVRVSGAGGAIATVEPGSRAEAAGIRRDDRLIAINGQRLSPLYVSVHATEPEVRRLMLGNPRAAEIMPQIDAMAEAGIQVHTQVVLCPGQNDGVHLEQTVRDLGSRFPAVQSIGVVPVGLTPRQ